RERGADRGSDPAAGSHRRRSVARRGRAPHGLRPDPIQSTIHGPGRAVPGTGRRAAARGLRPESEAPSLRPGDAGRRRGRGTNRRGHAVPRRRHRVGSPTPQQRLITHPPDATRALGAAMKEIWVEKYRPKSLDEVVGQDEIVERLKAYAKEGNLPHLLFAGPAG